MQNYTVLYNCLELLGIFLDFNVKKIIDRNLRIVIRIPYQTNNG